MLAEHSADRSAEQNVSLFPVGGGQLGVAVPSGFGSVAPPPAHLTARRNGSIKRPQRGFQTADSPPSVLALRSSRPLDP
eukprot:83312-Chlamydomonas_euryale.AAC.5